MEIISAIRGMNDILPAETGLWQYIENILRQEMQQFGYQEIRFPIVEKIELFKRSIGEATDIIEKEMYSFQDRNQDSLALRPEGTAGCVRAGMEHGLFYNQTQRLWYLGPCFRYERPQKGRYRQFHHCGAEVFGLEGPDIDAEVILLSATILEKLGLKAHVQLRVNSMGSSASRKIYREQLVRYLSTHQNQLDEDSKRRLLTNPLRILDSKNPHLQDIIAKAPKLTDYLSAEDQQHFLRLTFLLDQLNINYIQDPFLVRGLDYYSRTVFEWTTDALGAQGTVCGGGRYDGLIAQLGGNHTPALGFAMGLERTILLIQHIKNGLYHATAPHIYFLTDGDPALEKAFKLTVLLREHFRVILHCGGGPLKNQFKKADKSGAQIALILGEQELQQGAVTVKFLRQASPQVTLSQAELISFLQNKAREGAIQ